MSDQNAKSLLNQATSSYGSIVEDLKDHVIELIGQKRTILSPDDRTNMKFPKIVNAKLSIEALQDEFIPDFRFRNKEQLYRLLAGLEFKDEYTDASSLARKFYWQVFIDFIPSMCLVMKGGCNCLDGSNLERRRHTKYS